MRAVNWTMTHRVKTMVLATLFFIGSVFLIPLLPTGFIPPDDNSQTQVYLELPPGSTLQQTLAVAEQARVLVDGVEHVQSSCMHVKEQKYYADTAGTRARQQRVRIHPEFTALTVDRSTGQFESMRTLAPPTGRWGTRPPTPARRSPRSTSSAACSTARR